MKRENYVLSIQNCDRRSRLNRSYLIGAFIEVSGVMRMTCENKEKITVFFFSLVCHGASAANPRQRLLCKVHLRPCQLNNTL